MSGPLEMRGHRLFFLYVPVGVTYVMLRTMSSMLPYVFFFMLYTYAAALSVYMCVSSAWGIAEAKLVRRAIAKHGD